MNYSAIARALHTKCYEPQPRLCGGHFGYVKHRFPIKNGISWHQLMMLESFRPNVLLKMVRVDGKTIGAI